MTEGNQKFGLPSDQLAKLAGLKKTLPEKEEEKANPPVNRPAEKEPAKETSKKQKQDAAKQPLAEKSFTEEDAEMILRATLPEGMLEWNQKIVDVNERIEIFKQSLEKAIQKNDEYEIDAMEKSIEQETLKLVKLHEQEEGRKFDLEETAAWFGKTPEETEKVIERIEGKKVMEGKNEPLGAEEKPAKSVKSEAKKETEKIPAKEVKTAKKDELKEATAEKPEYSKKYLLSAIEESRIIGDKKLEVYYQSELDKLNKKKTAQAPVIKKSEQPSAEKVVPVKTNMPKFEQPPMAPKDNPAEEVEKESAEGLAGAVIKDSAERARTALEKKEEKREEKTEQSKEKVEEVKEQTLEELREERRKGIIKEIEKEWEEKNGPMYRPLSQREIEKNKEMARLWGKEWDGHTTQLTEAASEFFFDHRGMGKNSVPGRAEKILAERYPEYAEKAKGEKSAKKKKEKITEVEKEASAEGGSAFGGEKAEKQVGKEGLFGKETEKEEEIPLGAEAAVRPMEGEKKKPLVKRTEEEKKERAAEVEKFKEMKKARVAYAEKAKDYYKYQTILGKFKKVFGGKEEAAKVTEEFEAARIKYEKAQAEFNGEKILRHNAEERRRVNEIIGARAKENSTFEKFRAAYKWLGDQNLEKVIKPETKFGKIVCRTASLRTVVGLGLGATGFGLALSGGTAMAVGSALFLRKLYSGATSGLGTYEGLRMLAEKKTAISDEQIKNSALSSVNEKMAQIESWAILNGKKINEYPDYVKLRDKRTELLTLNKSAKISEALAGQFGRLNTEIDKRNRGEMYRKAAALGMGVFVGSGGMAWAFKKALYGVGIIHETPAPGAAKEVGVWKEALDKRAAEIIKESYVETAGGKFNSVWKMTEHQLQAHFGERFNGLNAAQKTYLIDYYKDIVAKNPKAFGLENIDVVKPGQKINFAPLFTDASNFEKGIGKALKLTAAETQNILHNNKFLREWVLSHPGERLTSAKVEELLKMPKGTMAEHFANDNMVVKPSGVTVNEIIMEQEKMRTAEIVHEMGERATARILNNTIQESGLTFEEYRAIKAVSVKQLLEQAHWDNWKAGTVDLPHDGIYGGTEFAHQVKLAEAIRSLNPSGGQMDMSVEDYLKGAINEGKFSSRGAIESAAGQAVPEGSPAEIEARPRGISPVETSARPKGAVAGVETATESKPKVVEAAAEVKGAPKFERMSNFIYDSDGKVSGAALEIKPEDTVRANGLMNDNWRETLSNNAELKNKSLAMSAIGNRARNIAAWQRMLEGLQNTGKGGSPEADYLRKAISRTIESTEKQYGDVFK